MRHRPFGLIGEGPEGAIERLHGVNRFILSAQFSITTSYILPAWEGDRANPVKQLPDEYDIDANIKNEEIDASNDHLELPQ